MLREIMNGDAIVHTPTSIFECSRVERAPHPVIRAAQTKRSDESSELAKDFARRARNKRMNAAEFQGGTFTVQIWAAMGSTVSSASLIRPQVSSWLLADHQK